MKNKRRRKVSKAMDPQRRRQKNRQASLPPQILQLSGGADLQIQSDNDSESDNDLSSDSDSDSDSSDQDSSSEESDDVVSQSKPGRTSYGSQKRDEIRSRKAAARERASKMASERRNKEVNLHKLTSISGGGVTSKPGPRR